jgi:hypothetical protein
MRVAGASILRDTSTFLLSSAIVQPFVLQRSAPLPPILPHSPKRRSGAPHNDARSLGPIDNHPHESGPYVRFRATLNGWECGQQVGHRASVALS